MAGKRVAAYTLGCKVNQYDTEAMLESFERAGYTAVPFNEEADVYIVNTCTVTGTGDQKSMKTIRRLARLHPDCAIVAAGCLTQREPEKLLALDNVRLAVGVQRRSEAVELLEQAIREDTKISAVTPLKGAGFENLFVSRHEGKTRATMKIQEGCDRYCSYCIIPFVRGPVRSMEMDALRKEAKRLADAGYREIVVTGILIAGFGRGTDYSLIDAVRAVHDTPGVERVRLGSLEPVAADDAFAKAVSEMPNAAHQFHLSLQSGSASVLRRMNRRYTPDEYFAACENLRRYMPDAAITTDIIVGFPGETEAEFEETIAFAKKCGLARLHVFPYSRRSGTVADRMPDQVPESVKHERSLRLIAVGNDLAAEYAAGTLGTIQRVLFETECGEGLCEGYTGTYVRVRAKAQPGEMKCVRITRVEGDTAYGEDA